MPRRWDDHYSDPANLDFTPVPLLVEVADLAPPGSALDLACGYGRNALYLAAFAIFSALLLYGQEVLQRPHLLVGFDSNRGCKFAVRANADAAEITFHGLTDRRRAVDGEDPKKAPSRLGLGLG